jgi:hypothetical protein
VSRPAPPRPKDDLTGLKSDEIMRKSLHDDDRTHYEVTPYGFVDTIEIRPLRDLPNMDAGRPCHLKADLYDSDGTRVPIDVVLVARGIK